MRLRRCGALLIEPRELLEFDLASLLQGGDGLKVELQWIALAPHLDEELRLQPDEVLALGAIGETHWLERDALVARHGEAVIERLRGLGLLVVEAGGSADDDAVRDRDERQRSNYWHLLSAVQHRFSRWREVDCSDALTQSGMRTVADMVAKFGLPPPHVLERVPPQQRIALPPPRETELARLMDERATCRNFDRSRTVPREAFAAILHRVFAAHATLEAAPGACVLKKTSPSGGGLHSTEAYVLVQQVEDVAPGLYHYHAGDHALEPLPCEAGDGEALQALAHEMIAGQYWFANAHVHVIMAPRYRRSFWKYRNHAKAYRAMILDGGHLSQTLYLTATELGLGAFVTSAINETRIEDALGLDPLMEGPLAICGFGWRGGTRETVEFDPLKRVWKD